MDLETLKQKYSNCTKCSDLCQSRSQVVFGSGNSSAKILIIGEAPGASEDRDGIPFCGASGKVLAELLESIGLTRDDVFISNTILCRPEKNRNPRPEEVKNCSERLEQLIVTINPKVIATVGNFATKAVIGKTGITTIRGQIFETQVLNKIYKVVPVVHPANYLYNGRAPPIMQQMKKDFAVIAGIIDQDVYENPKGQATLFQF